MGLKSFSCWWLIFLGAIALLPIPNWVSTGLAADPTLRDPQNQLNQIPYTIAQFPEIPVAANWSVPTVARLVTVRILGEQGGGSGVIVARQGNIYTVLTNAHVVAETGSERHTILTADGQTHLGLRQQRPEFGNYDLALVQFRSDRSYQVAVMGNSDNLSIGEPLYASGFPSWRFVSSNHFADTRNLGINAFQFTQGQVGMIPSKPLQRGYQLGYTNQIDPGMSGGPVFDQYGRLVGVNGGLKHPLQGIVAFIFADGTMPNQALFQQMETFSWAIPIASFQRLLMRSANSVPNIY